MSTHHVKNLYPGCWLVFPYGVSPDEGAEMRVRELRTEDDAHRWIDQHLIDGCDCPKMTGREYGFRINYTDEDGRAPRDEWSPDTRMPYTERAILDTYRPFYEYYTAIARVDVLERPYTRR
jgi:hypothetical protein